MTFGEPEDGVERARRHLIKKKMLERSELIERYREAFKKTESQEQRLHLVKLLQNDIKEGKLEADDLVADGVITLESVEVKNKDGKVVRVDTIVPHAFAKITEKAVKTPSQKRRQAETDAGDESDQQTPRSKKILSETDSRAPRKTVTPYRVARKSSSKPINLKLTPSGRAPSEMVQEFDLSKMPE